MKHLLKYLLAAAVLPLWGQAAAAGPFGQLRGLCEPGKSVLLTAPTVVEGIVVSDYRSPNMELNPNLNYYSVDLEPPTAAAASACVSTRRVKTGSPVTTACASISTAAVSRARPRPTA